MHFSKKSRQATKVGALSSTSPGRSQSFLTASKKIWQSARLRKWFQCYQDRPAATTSSGQRWLIYSKNTKRGKLSLANGGLGLKSSPKGPLISSPYLAVNPLLPRSPSGRGGGTLGCCSLGGHPGRCPVT